MKKFLFSTVSIATFIFLTACGNKTNDDSTKVSVAKQSSEMMAEKTNVEKERISVGEIVGDFNSSDGKVNGATKPGEKVSFEVPMNESTSEYLHFAFMHAASGKSGWYFAPKTEDGINLSEISKDETIDITDEIALYEAPDKDTVMPVKKSMKDLEYGPSEKYLKATIEKLTDMYKVTIENISTGKYETPFSSGVWEVLSSQNQGFDTIPSEALSNLATSGHRDMLYNQLKK